MNTSLRAETLRSAATALREAERPVRILRHISWPAEVRQRFFERGQAELPEVEYLPFLQMESVELGLAKALQAAERLEDPLREWIVRQAQTIRTAGRMLLSTGTPQFYHHSRELYGEPKIPLPDGQSTSLALAEAVDRLSRDAAEMDLGAPDPACHLADGVAARVRAAAERVFGAHAPRVEVVDELSSNAIAGPRMIRIRRSACFTDRDARQLIEHEAFVHVCTSLNGLEQTELPILSAGHPGTTRTQEGLAVFGELISGSLEPNRFRRLADRVLAIQMSIDGADFLDVYRYFLERTDDPPQSFENARRVFRGGVLTGGAPFTKDDVYLDGLTRVITFMRAAVTEGRADCLILLFSGKLDIEDLPALSALRIAGLLKPPRFLPPWMADRRFLVSYLTLSRFLGQMDMGVLRAHYLELIDRTAGLHAPAGQ